MNNCDKFHYSSLYSINEIEPFSVPSLRNTALYFTLPHSDTKWSTLSVAFYITVLRGATPQCMVEKCPAFWYIPMAYFAITVL